MNLLIKAFEIINNFKLFFEIYDFGNILNYSSENHSKKINRLI
jgi:hypothetical protein